MNKTAVIIGAGAAGLATADGLRDRGWPGRIVVVGDETHVPYDRPPLSKHLLAGDRDFSFVQLTTAEGCEEREIELKLGCGANKVDREEKKVHLSSGETLDFDALVIATGVNARTLPACTEIEGVVSLRTYEDSMALRKLMAEQKHMVIVGAGFIGLEVAATAVSKGCIVDVIEPAPSALMGKFPAALTERIVETHRKKGVRFHFGQVVQEWNAELGSISSVTLSNGQTLKCDLALVGIGTIPAIGWVEGSGLELENGIVCDSTGQAADSIFAVGDVANWFHPMLGKNFRVEHRLSAGEQAQVVSAVLCGTEIPHMDLPFFWTDQYDEKWQAYGYVNAEDDLEIVVDDVEANRLVAVLRREGEIQAVVGKNAAKLLMPYRRDLRSASLDKNIKN